MSIDEDFRTHLISSTSISAVIGTRAHQNHVPERSSYPAIWFRRAAEQEEVLLDGRAETKRITYDLECLSTSIDVAIDLAQTVKATLHGYAGTMSGSTATCQGIFVENQDDDYLPYNEGSDDGRTVAALSIALWST